MIDYELTILPVGFGKYRCSKITIKSICYTKIVRIRRYFSICETPTALRTLNAWILRRLRACLWKQWKLPKTKLRELRKRGLPDSLAGPLAVTRKGPWHISANGYLTAICQEHCQRDTSPLYSV